MKRAFVTGAAGQLAHFLILQLQEKGIQVVGLVHDDNQAKAMPLPPGDIHVGDIVDMASIARALAAAPPDVVFHLASPTFVPDSWSKPQATLEAVALGTLNVLDAVRLVAPAARVVCASSSEVFALARETPQTTATPLAPATPYGIGKAAAFQLTRAYRERHGLSACSLVLYPFESALRADNFVVPKICRAAARIGRHGSRERLKLGDTSAQRDWCWAEDVAQAFILAGAAEQPRDALIGTGELHRVSEVVERAFAYVGLDWREHVEIESGLVRPPERVLMTPDVQETKSSIGWVARTRFEEIVHRMVDSASVR